MAPSTVSTTLTPSIVPDPGRAAITSVGSRHRGRTRCWHDRRRPARPHDAPGRDRARAVAAGARGSARRACCAGHAGRAAGRGDGPRRRCGRSRAAARPSRSTTSRCRRSTCGRWSPRASPCTPGRTRSLHAQDKLVMRRRLADARASPGRGSPRSPRRTTWSRSAGSGGAEGRARRLRRPRRVARPHAGAGRRAARGGHPADGRGARADAPRAGRVGGALAVRAGGGVAGRRDRAGRRPVRRGARPRPRARRRACRGHPGAGAADRRRSWASPGCSRWSCSRPRTASWSTSWRCARTTRGTGRSRARARRSSSSTCARCSTTRWGRRRPPRPPS